jgi:hypothetical protein
MSVENPVFTFVSLHYCFDNNMVNHTSKSLYFYLPLKWRLSWINTQPISDTYISRIIIISEWAEIAKSVWRPATGRTVGESNPGGDEIFRSRPVWTWVLYNGYWVSFPGLSVQGVALITHTNLMPRFKKELNHTTAHLPGFHGLF